MLLNFILLIKISSSFRETSQLMIVIGLFYNLRYLRFQGTGLLRLIVICNFYLVYVFMMHYVLLESNIQLLREICKKKVCLIHDVDGTCVSWFKGLLGCISDTRI